MAEGSHRRIYERLGAHPTIVDGVDGVAFAVWAPNAQRVSVVGDFNQWDGRRHPMRKTHRSGELGDLPPGRRQGGALQVRASADEGRAASPEGRSARLPPRTAASDRLDGPRPANPRMARCAMGGVAARPTVGDRTDLDLRGASRLVAARRRQPLPHLRRARRRADSVRARTLASPTSSACLSPSIRSRGHGATSRSAFSRQPPATENPKALRDLSTAAIRRRSG